MRMSFSFSWSLPLLGLVILASLSLTAARDIKLSNEYLVTTVDLEDKNSGSMADGLLDGGDNDGTEESIRWGATALQRGSQLQIVTAALQAIGDVTTAQSMLSLESVVGAGTDVQQMLLAATAGNLLKYHNGSVLPQVQKNPLYVNLIFYGQQWTKKDIGVIENFVKSLNPPIKGGVNDRTVDRWWAISTNYYHDYKNQSIASNIVLKPSLKDASSQAPRGGSKAKPLTDKNMRKIITRAMNGQKPVGANVYFILTSEEVYVKNFGSVLCTYHSSFRFQKSNIPYAFVGNPATQALSSCSYRYYDPYAQTSNGVAVDAMVNWFAHSLTKMATNPYPNRNGNKGWVIGGTGLENADLCSWDFGYVGVVMSADKKSYSTYNIKGGSLKYLIQRNFNTKTKKCVIIARDVDDSPIPFQ